MARSPMQVESGRSLRLQAMFDGAAIGIAICDLNGRILEANRGLEQMLGYDGTEFAGLLVTELHSGPCRSANEECVSANAGTNHNAEKSAGNDFDYVGPRADGSQNDWLNDWIRGGRKFFEMTNGYRRKNGSEFWGCLTLSLAFDDLRQPALLIATLTDATEFQQALARLRQAEEMESVGRLTASIAHDFNNLLTGILLYCDLLAAGAAPELAAAPRIAADSKRVGDGVHPSPRAKPESWSHVEEIRAASEQGAALTHQLLAIVRKQVAEPQAVRINDVVASTEPLLRRLIGEQIELIVSLDPRLEGDAEGERLMVLAHPSQLRQVLLNLVLNARDAMPRGGRIELSTRACSGPSSRGAPSLVSLVVQDNGRGMEAYVKRRLFEPFFTTKNPGSGTGLGLATVRRIVSAAGGRILVESELGRGTRIEVLLPASPASSNFGRIGSESEKAAEAEPDRAAG